MGMKIGRWTGASPRERKYPFEIAAKMARDIKSVKQDEAGQMVSDTRYFYDKFNDQCAEINELKNKLSIAEQTVKLLQVSDS